MKVLVKPVVSLEKEKKNEYSLMCESYSTCGCRTGGKACQCDGGGSWGCGKQNFSDDDAEDILF